MLKVNVIGEGSLSHCRARSAPDLEDSRIGLSLRYIIE